MMAAVFAFGVVLPLVSASSFLQARPHTEKSVSRALVQETLKAALSMEPDALNKLEGELRPMYTALPKDKTGALEPAVVRYALHRYFVQKHGWHLKGMEPAGHVANASSPASLLKDQVPEFVQGLLEKQTNGQGWHLHELAISAAALSELIRREMVQDLDFVYNLLGLSPSSSLDDAQLEQVITMYLAQYLVEESFTDMRPEAILNEVEGTYDRWGELKMWAQDIWQALDHNEALQRNPFVRASEGHSFQRVEHVIQEIMDRYSSFQSLECNRMTDVLLDMEHQSTGRVPLGRFYDAGVAHVWEFWEPKEYLQHSGALDNTDPKRPAVIIPNYVYGMNNCLASSSFFSVCCTNKCEQLVGHLEGALAASSGSPQRVAELVSLLPSESVDAPRSLSAEMLARLEEIASIHDGEVPLHGRLFSQWLHHAYPRECPFPHVDGEKSPLTPEAWAAKFGRDYSLSVAEMQALSHRHRHGARDQQEGLPWSSAEELVGDSQRHRKRASGLWRKGMAFVVVAAVALPLLRAWNALLALGADPSMPAKHHMV